MRDLRRDLTRGDPADAQSPDFDDSGWRAVRMPHGWSVELSFAQEETGGSTPSLPGGIGWFRKTFQTPAGAITWIEFDGVYTNSEVWINGHYLGEHPYGYVHFSCDLTPRFKIESLRAVLTVWELTLPGVDYVDFGPSDLSFDLGTHPHPVLKTVEDCVAFVRAELEGVDIRIF